MAEEIKSGLFFVASNIEVSGELPVEIAPGIVFRKAREAEVEIYKRLIDLATEHGYSMWVRYDAILRRVPIENGEQLHQDPIPREMWRFWVVAHEGANGPVHDLEPVALLLPTEIEFAANVFFTGSDQQGQMMGRSSIRSHVIEKYGFQKWDREIQTTTTAELQRIGALRALAVEAESAFPFVTHALRNFFQLRSIPANSELLVVGYFSVLESLATHKPRSAETLDSIVHQVSNKMILLRKKFARDIHPRSYFASNADEVKLWKKLYEYRSTLAHGDAVRWSDFRELKSREAVASFLRETIKELLLLGLRDPEFLSDLRKC